MLYVLLQDINGRRCPFRVVLNWIIKGTSEILDMRSSWVNKISVILGSKPPFSWLILCLISVLALIAVLGTSTSNAFDSVTTTPVSDIYASYRRQKERAEI